MTDASDPRLGSRSITSVVFDEASIQARVRELGEEISRAYRPEDRLLVVGLLKGALLFTADLIRHIHIPLQVDFLVAASYGAGKKSTGEVAVHHRPPADLTGRPVLLVEDIIDTGTTLSVLVPGLEARGASRVDVCALLDKKLPSARVEARWVGFDAPNAFLVGYGLDHAEDFRHLPYIASL